ERERERERERDASSVIIKRKFLLCQNTGAFFYTSGFVVSIPLVTCKYFKLYTNFILGWLGKLCQVELLYRCRSNTGQCNALPVSHHYTHRSVANALRCVYFSQTTTNLNNKQ
ncbi:hypothetical protein, partial [Dysgonomonas capnocytophagoides]|uniref:hypothetical protein n=1 Tax=Dysgonomonas capnocytophagoides TaxID=45254 RepID=UPI003341FB26